MKIKLLIFFAATLVIAIVAVPAVAQLNSTQGQPIKIDEANIATPVDSLSANYIDWSAYITGPLQSTSNQAQVVDPGGIQRLIADTGGATVSIAPATGAARFVRLTPAQANSLSAKLGTGGSIEAQAAAFFSQYGSIFGISNASAELNLVNTETDNLGTTHLTYQQIYQSVPVFAGWLRVHFNANNQITAVNGTFIPRINLNTTPAISVGRAATTALEAITGQKATTNLSVRQNTLYVFRADLARGKPGPNYLVYEVEVTDGRNIREFVYVDAHTGKIVDQVSAIQEALYRQVFSGTFTTTARIWKEGDPLPYTGVFSQDINNLITGTKESYDLFFRAFGRDSYDGGVISGTGAIMNTVNNDPTIACPNANWNGTTTNYCNGVTADDVVAHEWAHAYTEYTSNLIYQWQSGALNEAYSDIFGETVDLINGRGSDTPGPAHTNFNSCSQYSTPRKYVTVNSPAGIAGNYATAGAAFGPPLTVTGTTGDLALVNDGDDEGGIGSTTDACQPLSNAAAINGKIALIELADFSDILGPCAPTVAVKNAQNAGAIAAIVINDTDSVRQIPGSDGTITIPSGKVGNRIGNTIKAQLSSGVNVTLRQDNTTPENSYRWLVGEDASAFGESIRDMWNPTCYRHPGKVSDSQYHCSIDDNGGVHRNSGIPNHAFALIVDGGTYNGQTIAGLGVTKAAHIYWRAQDVYQEQATDFAEHADALETSCMDLLGTNLNNLSTGAPSGQIISLSDCSQVTKTMLAVEMRNPPTQCNFQPLLAQNPPALCNSGATTPIFSDTFETVMTTTWVLTNQGVFAEYVPRNWQWVAGLPQSRPGHAFFAVDDPNLGNCIPGNDDQSGVVRLMSPVITLPTTGMTSTVVNLVFDHNLASEPGWDGGNLKVRINGGPFQLITPTQFIYNPYNSTIFSNSEGNTNPLAGEFGFTGSDGGEVVSLWGQSQVNLFGLAGPGDTVQFRFDFGTDGCGGNIGWYVDNVQVNYCSGGTVYLPIIPKN